MRSADLAYGTRRTARLADVDRIDPARRAGAAPHEAAGVCYRTRRPVVWCATRRCR